MHHARVVGSEERSRVHLALEPGVLDIGEGTVEVQKMVIARAIGAHEEPPATDTD